MRYTLFLPTLTLLIAGILCTTTIAQTPVSASVQEAIDRITALNGRHTLTPDNTIRAITFTDGSSLNAAMFDLFAQQSDLETLHIDNYRELNDAMVAKLTGLTKLRSLTLTNSGITDAAIRTIADSFPNLTVLNVSSNTQLTDAATREIARLQQLEDLRVRFCDFSEFGMLNIARLPKLRVLDIRANMRVGDGGMRTLAALPSLTHLMHRSPVTDFGIEALTAARSLQHLEVEDFAITGQSGQHIRRMENLNSLIIFRCENFDSQGLLDLEGMKLTRLTLRSLPIEDSAMEVFSGLTTLRRLFLQELPSVTDAGMANLAHLKDLAELDIWDTPIGDKSLETIAKLPALRILWLRETNITDAGLELLLTAPSLQTVRLVGNANVTPAMIQKLRDAEKFRVE